MRLVPPAILCVLCLPGDISAHPVEETLEELVVTGRREHLAGEARSASEGVVGQMDLAIRPLLRPGDVLEAVPSLIVTQHSGSGKSNQMFLRGFNLDHGTDFSTSIDGMPVNLRSHGHGQGYTDINFLIPETVARINFVKGPYHAELGDFSSAGGAEIETSDVFNNQLTWTAGENGFHRGLAMGSLATGSMRLSGALEVQRYDGAWTDVDEDVKKLNGLLKLGGSDDGTGWQTTLMHYDNEWNAADQIPERAVAAGVISPLGSIDTTLGGDTRRSSLSGAYQRREGGHTTRWTAYLVDYEMNLYSNFTYRLDDPAQGDQFQQVDDRRILGGSYHHHWNPSETLQHRWGIAVQHDDIGKVGLYRTQARERSGTVRQDTVEETSLGAHYEAIWSLSPRWRAVLGARADHYSFDVDAEDPRNSGTEQDTLFSPKASLIYRASAATEWYASTGQGFHSNDARGVTQQVDPVTGEEVSSVDSLVSSRGAELGVKTQWQQRWILAAALWYLELDSELLFVGDAGTTEATRPSERWGLELNNFWMIDEVWSLEADIAWTDARFSDDAIEGRHIPGALKTVASATLSAQTPAGWFGALRVRYVDGAPLIEDATVRAHSATLAHLSLGWAGQRYSLRADVLNLLDSDDRDIEYFYPSRLEGEPLEGVEDRHFHRFEPRQVRVTLTINL
jgi:outer membrane receptor protein involved in Fe transport